MMGFVAPMVAPTAGATNTAARQNNTSSGMLSSLGGPPKNARSATAATIARAVFATSASKTHDKGQWERFVAACTVTPARMYQIQWRRCDATSAAVRAAYGAYNTAAPIWGYRSRTPSSLPTNAIGTKNNIPVASGRRSAWTVVVCACARASLIVLESCSDLSVLSTSTASGGGGHFVQRLIDRERCRLLPWRKLFERLEELRDDNL